MIKELRELHDWLSADPDGVRLLALAGLVVAFIAMIGVSCEQSERRSLARRVEWCEAQRWHED